MSGRDVGELWAQLKAQGAPPPARRSGPTLSGLAGLPGITSHVRTYDKSRGPRLPEQRPSFIAQLGQPGAPAQEQHAQSSTGDHQALLASLQRDINGLSDPDRSTRRRSVEKLHAALLGPSGGVAPAALQAVLAGPLLVPLVRLLADPAEKCRELAAGLLAAALLRLPAPGALLPTVVPALAERVGSAPPQEPSEEMRLVLAELLAGPLLGTLCEHSAAAGQAAPQGMLPADLLPPLCATLCYQLADPYADIKKAACTSVAHLASLAGPGPDALPAALLEPLVAALVADLAHQHSRVRLAALQALHALVQRGMPLAAMQEAVLPAVRPLAHDHAPAIRAALFSCAARWAGSQLPADGAGDEDGRAANQCRTFLPLLLPLILLGLTDEVEATRSDTFAQLEAIGARLAGQASWGMPEPLLLAALGQPAQLPGYCHPFSRRPSAATRVLVQAQLTCLLQQSLAELREWTATLQVSAARLLRASLIYGEAEVLPLLPTVVLGLQSAVADDDAGVATHAVGCVQVLGCNLPPRHWMPLAAEAVAAEQQSIAQRTAALVVLSALLYAASKSGASLDSDALQLGAAALSSPSLAAAAAASDGGPLRQQLLAACSNLVRWAGARVAGVGPQLFGLMLQLWSAEADGSAAQPAAGSSGSAAVVSGDAAAAPTAAAVLDQLAAALGRASAAELCDLYGPEMLRRCTQGHEQWTQAHPDWRTAAALLRLSGSTALLQLWPTALPAVQQIAADHDRDPRLRLELLHLLAVLLEDDSKAAAWPQAGAGQQLVAAVLAPALAWRAGRVPAAARYAALTALCTLLARGRLPADQLAAAAALPGTPAAGAAAVAHAPAGTSGEAAAGEHSQGGSLLALVAGCLDEEYEPDTRQLACRTLALLLDAAGPLLPAAQLAALQPGLLPRLDDSSNAARVAACAALQAWLACLVAPAGGAPGLAEADASALASSMLIHLEDPDAEVAEAVARTLAMLASARPAAVRALVQAAAAAQRRRPDLLGQVLAACEGGGCAP
ncbi:hypothetical protein ABPG75_003147 [Micractinium tetrahymenae]